jgi:hypothetical protein
MAPDHDASAIRFVVSSGFVTTCDEVLLRPSRFSQHHRLRQRFDDVPQDQLPIGLLGDKTLAAVPAPVGQTLR